MAVSCSATAIGSPGNGSSGKAEWWQTRAPNAAAKPARQFAEIFGRQLEMAMKVRITRQSADHLIAPRRFVEKALANGTD
jgi:hypothetical protein